MATSDHKPPDDEELGLDAARLFHKHAADNQCNNHELLRKAIHTSYRVLRSPVRHDQQDFEDWNLDESHLLPTPARIKDAVADDGQFMERLRCQCDLCKSHEIDSKAAISELGQSSDDRAKAIAVILLCGCLFALGSFLHHHSESDSNVLDFAEEVCKTPGRLFDTSTSDRNITKCTHEWWQPEQPFVNLHACCKAQAFRAAVSLKTRITKIPELKRGGSLLSYDKRNMPFIGERIFSPHKEKLNPRFLIAKVEPTRCAKELVVRSPFP
jgi:hypothetical protein